MEHKKTATPNTVAPTTTNVETLLTSLRIYTCKEENKNQTVTQVT
jgi:hypothetical protein